MSTAQTRYEFFNFTEQSFTGRYGGVDYTFAPNETRSFDPDKHYMLILLSKQLADRELEKKVKGVGRDPKDMETWGKALDHVGKPIVITKDMRKTIMRLAIGSLVDLPIPIPEDQEVVEEAGSTKEINQDVKALQSEVSELKDMVQSLVSHASKTQPRVEPSVPMPDAAVPATEPTSMTRSALVAIAQDLGITDTDSMTKEELIHTVSGKQTQI